MRCFASAAASMLTPDPAYVIPGGVEWSMKARKDS
jgi:hypothetical protein